MNISSKEANRNMGCECVWARERERQQACKQAITCWSIQISTLYTINGHLRLPPLSLSLSTHPEPTHSSPETHPSFCKYKILMELVGKLQMLVGTSVSHQSLSLCSVFLAFSCSVPGPHHVPTRISHTMRIVRSISLDRKWIEEKKTVFLSLIFVLVEVLLLLLAGCLPAAACLLAIFFLLRRRVY